MHSSNPISALRCPSLHPCLHPIVLRGLAEGCTVLAAISTRIQAPQGQRLSLAVSPAPSTGRGQVWLPERVHCAGWSLEPSARVRGKAVLTTPHRWKVTLLLPPWLPTDRVTEVLGADSECIRAKGSVQVERHPASCPQPPTCSPPRGPSPCPVGACWSCRSPLLQRTPTCACRGTGLGFGQGGEQGGHRSWPPGCPLVAFLPGES